MTTTATGIRHGGTLNRRERQVLDGMARGLSNAGIAVELGIATNTVKTYGRSLFTKLGVSTRLDAVAEGRRRGLVGGRCTMCGHRPPPDGRTGVRAAQETWTGLTGAPEATGGPR